VGVHQATIRLKDGQRIRVDGSTGKISVLGESKTPDHPSSSRIP
jgi:phosphohistidine swiveling domain-containing protein